MFTSMKDFENAWKSESTFTQNILNALTDESLSQSVNDDHRTIGRIAWHICETIPDMMNELGCTFEKVTPPVPTDAKTIQEKYKKLSTSLLEELKRKLTDADLLDTHEIYGETWQLGLTLLIFMKHEIHHRGQLTVLMRQAGVTVPSMYGPAKEGWSEYNTEPPVI